MRKQTITNPFYENVLHEGLRIRNERPVCEGRTITNPYYERIRQSGGVRLRTRRGRPSRGESAGVTVVKSVRLPPTLWKRIKAQAESEGLTVHAALRQAVLIWLQS